MEVLSLVLQDLYKLLIIRNHKKEVHFVFTHYRVTHFPQNIWLKTTMEEDPEPDQLASNLVHQV